MQPSAATQPPPGFRSLRPYGIMPLMNEALMTAEDVLDIVTVLERAGVAVWLDGGWAVDALLGCQTRQHDDLDVVVDLGEADALKRELAQRGLAV